MAAPFRGVGTRGQIPGVGSLSQPRRRNAVNAPRTWRGTKAQLSSNAVVSLAGTATSASQGAATTSVTDPLAAIGLTGSVGRATLNIRLAQQGRALTGARASGTLTVTQNLAGAASSGSSGSSTVAVAQHLAGVAPAASTAVATIRLASPTLLTRTYPGVGAKGQARRRNPVNAPRTWRGTKPLQSHNAQISLTGSSVSATRATASNMVAIRLTGAGSTGALGRGTITAGQQLHGIGATGSLGTASLPPVIGLAGSARSGVEGSATLAAPASTLFAAPRIPGVGAVGQPKRRNPVNAPRTFRGTRVQVPPQQTFGPVALQALASSGSLAAAIFFVLVQSFEGLGDSGSIGRATLTVTGPFHGGAQTGTRGTGTLKVTVPLQGRSKLGTRGQATLSQIASFDGIARTGTTAKATPAPFVQGRARTGARSSGILTVTIPIAARGATGSRGISNTSILNYEFGVVAVADGLLYASAVADEPLYVTAVADSI